MNVQLGLLYNKVIIIIIIIIINHFLCAHVCVWGGGGGLGVAEGKVITNTKWLLSVKTIILGPFAKRLQLRLIKYTPNKS